MEFDVFALCIKFLFTHRRCTSTDADNDDDANYVVMPAVFRRAGFCVTYLYNQYTRTFYRYADFTCGYFLNPPKINDACFDMRNDELCPYDDEPYDNIFRIPMMIWMSPTFSARHSDVAERLRNAVDRQLCSEDLPYLLYDLANIDFNHNDKSCSLISDLYTPHKTVIVE